MFGKILNKYYLILKFKKKRKMLTILLIIWKYFLHSYLGKQHHLLIITLKFLYDVSLECVLLVCNSRSFGLLLNTWERKLVCLQPSADTTVMFYCFSSQQHFSIRKQAQLQIQGTEVPSEVYPSSVSQPRGSSQGYEPVGALRALTAARKLSYK